MIKLIMIHHPTIAIALRLERVEPTKGRHDRNTWRTSPPNVACQATKKHTTFNCSIDINESVWGFGKFSLSLFFVKKSILIHPFKVTCHIYILAKVMWWWSECQKTKAATWDTMIHSLKPNIKILDSDLTINCTKFIYYLLLSKRQGSDTCLARMTS